MAERQGFSVRLAQRVVAAVIRQPWLVLGVALVIVAASIAYSAECLTYKTQRNDLLSPEKDCQRRWQRYIDAFGEDEDFVFVIRGGTKARMTSAADHLAAKLRSKPDQFDRIFHSVDLRPLQSRSLQYLPPDELTELDRRLDDLAPLLGPLSPVGWHALSIESLMRQAASAQVMLAKGGAISSSDRRLLAELPGILRAATQSLSGPEEPVSAWSHTTVDDSRLTQPHYFFTADAKLCMVLARTRTQSDSFTPALEACGIARKMLAETRAEFPDLDLGLTGLPVLEADEMAASGEDSNTANYLAFGGVMVLYVLVYRGVRNPLMTLSVLGVGTILALGWATLTIGHLNILSAAFAVMLIGLGDYGVITVALYDENRRLGLAVNESLLKAIVRVGPSIITASCTAALAFGATMLADFQAVVELGWIAGWGVLFCAAASFTVLPALIVVSENYRKPRDQAAPLSRLAFPATERAFLPKLASRPIGVLRIGAVVIFALTIGVTQVKYDANLLHLQAGGLDSVYWEEELIQHSAGMTWDALSLAGSREEALRLKAKYEATPGVGLTIEAATLVSGDFEAKKGTLASIHRKIGGLPSTVPDFSLVTASMVQSLSQRVAGAESVALQRALAELPTEVATARLRAFDAKLRRDLHADLRRLAGVSDPSRIALEDLPAGLRERYISPNGTFLVRAFASDSLWDFPALERFTQAAQTADANATGKSFRTVEGLRQMKAGFLRAGAAALIVIIVVLALDFRSLKNVLLALMPLALGMIATLGAMGWLGVPLNPANLIALPLIIGVGLDNGVHVFHEHLDRHQRGRYRLSAVLGRGISIKSFTTILGFGTLMIARHRGMASLGLTLTLGVTACMSVALVLLPAILSLWPQTKVKVPSIVPLIFRARIGEKVAA